MGRKPIDPQKKKRPVSFTLTSDQKKLCEWTAKQLDISASELVGNLIEKEANRISKIKKLPISDNFKKKLY